nr:PREDICTED: tumor necrosis factor receptor superfamily member 10B-like isoform X1 [Latimeria chalumnae]|eukprot:XP_014344870.1 PREDICTED: tumor necrosis factor receptor superfamily member 10B-like isoform X1 [Latimeria chalumnae]
MCNRCRRDQVMISSCTSVKNTVCECKPGKYCLPNHTCEICHLCRTSCPKGKVILQRCNATSDTVCGLHRENSINSKTQHPSIHPPINSKTQSDNLPWIIVVLFIIVCVLIICCVCLKKNQRLRTCIDNGVDFKVKPILSLCSACRTNPTQLAKDNEREETSSMDEPTIMIQPSTSPIKSEIVPLLQSSEENPEALGEQNSSCSVSETHSSCMEEVGQSQRSGGEEVIHKATGYPVLAKDSAKAADLVPSKNCRCYLRRQEILPNWSYLTEVNDSPEDALVKSFYYIIDEIPAKEWKNFMRNLDIKDHDIDTATEDNPHNSKEQKYQMLRTWYNKFGKDASICVLLQVLFNMNLKLCADNIIIKLIEKCVYKYCSDN